MHKFLEYNINPDVVKNLPHLATFTLSPLESGFGITLANALRRILLSSIPGAAVFAIKIPGISHEFSTIPGVIEDLSHIIINIKKLVIKIDEKIFDSSILEECEIEKWPVLKLSVNQAKIVTAGDIECPPGFQIMNPELEICESTTEEGFVMNLYAMKGRGYRSFHENRELVNSLNIIAIDSLFSPIIKVEWKVEEEKSSKRGTSDTLTFVISTNGAITAYDAFAYAAQILKSYLEPIININEEIANYNVIKKKDDQQKKAVLSTSIDDLELTMRSFNCLKRHGIHTIQELIDLDKNEIEKIRNLGKKSLKEIIRKLTERNLSFKAE